MPSTFKSNLFIMTLLAFASLVLVSCERAAPTIPPPTSEPTLISGATQPALTSVPTVARTPAASPVATSPTTPQSNPTTPPNPTATPTRVVNPPPAATATPTPVSGSNTTQVKIFLIALDDNGKAGKRTGCNDSVVAVERTIARTAAVLTAALNELLSLREQNYGQSGLYNALWRANLKLESIGSAGTRWTIRLTGSLSLGGVCDAPRVKAQLEETALQFATVRSVDFFINGVPLDQALSSR